MAMEYVNGVADIAKSERHHPTILIHDRVKVDISLDTHDTVERPAVLPDARTILAQWPGLTLRDFRMALLLNPLVAQYKGSSSSLSTLDTPSLDQLLDIRIKSL
ncbi:hypothetical protein RhiJN_21750 [Ceratobasidium sp. AG-Ba]|nr:hypothetical protein RhiJN_21750 [Ceratobasidium sp. AG-Ba]